VVPAHQAAEFYVKAKTPLSTGSEPQKLVIAAEAPGTTLQPITIVVHPDRGALPQ
jgi:hypothetical protein